MASRQIGSAGPAASAGSTAFAAVCHLIETAVDAGVVPGAVILCASEGVTRCRQAFGVRQLQPERQDATTETIYDIASLTKAVCTSVLTMQAVSAGLVTLDDRVARHLPEFHGAGKETVTIRQLLCHASGLPAHRPFYEGRMAAGGGGRGERDAILMATAGEPLINPPGSVSVYSDLGFILLGWILERVTGSALDEQFRRAVSDPLGLGATTFVDLGDRGARGALLARGQVAPTERCPVRGRLAHGEVHDLNAFAMGGVAGHAGLFSAVDDLGTLSAALVHVWQGGDRAGGPGPTPRPPSPSPGTFSISRDALREFWRAAGVPHSTWRLGWDGPAVGRSQAGARMSREAVGHLGFTGCSLWIDPARALWVVLLTNRVHPTAQPDPRFRDFRAAVHDAAVAALTG